MIDMMRKKSLLLIILALIPINLVIWGCVDRNNIKNSPYIYIQGTITNKHEAGSVFAPSGGYLEITLNGDGYGKIMHPANTSDFLLLNKGDMVYVVLTQKDHTIQDQVAEVVTSEKELELYIKSQKERKGRDVIEYDDPNDKKSN